MRWVDEYLAYQETGASPPVDRPRGRPRDMALINKLRALAATGRILRDVAAAAGISYSSASRYCHLYGIAVPDLRGRSRYPERPVTRANMPEIARLRAEGGTLREIGARFGVTAEYVRLLLVERGDPALIGAVSRQFRPITKPCEVCGGPITGLVGKIGKRRTCSPECLVAHATARQHKKFNCMEMGEIIARRRIAGETWAAIAVSYGKKPNHLPYFHRNARRYLKHVNAPEETWRIVFPLIGSGFAPKRPRRRTRP